MKLTPHQDGAGALSIHVEGDLTIYQAAETRAALLALVGDASTVELDLACVGEIDSAGLQLLLATARTVSVREGRFSLARPSAAVAEAIGLLGLGRHLPVAA